MLRGLLEAIMETHSSIRFASFNGTIQWLTRKMCTCQLVLSIVSCPLLANSLCRATRSLNKRKMNKSAELEIMSGTVDG